MKWLKNITVYVFIGINAVTILLLWLSCAVTYLDPAHFPRWSLLSLTFPLTALCNLAFIVFWLVFKVRRVWIPLVGFLACGGFVWDYCPLNFSKDVAEGDNCLMLLSYNTQYFGGKEARDDQGNNAIANYIYNSQADIICLQESAGGGADLTTVRNNMAELGYGCYDENGVVLFSKLPIVETGELPVPTRTNGGIYAKLVYEQDTILLINNHFESNHFSQIVKDDYRDALKRHARNAYEQDVRDTLRRELSPMVNLLAVAAPLRAAQADTILHLAEQWLPRPVIVMGDFNDTPISYAIQKLSEKLTNAYTQSGTGTGFTFHERGFPVRIDHILFSGEYWKSHHTYTDKAQNYSDHYPILTKLTRK